MSAPAVAPPSRRPLARLYDFVFGFDYFISHRWRDAHLYAVQLAAKLEPEFHCFLDSKDFAKGLHWTVEGKRALTRTSILILVLSPEIFDSEPVLEEVCYFQAHKPANRLIAIDPGGLFARTAPDHPLIAAIGETRLRIDEPAGALQAGPSAALVDTLRQDFDLVKQNTRRARVLAGAVSVLAVLLAAAIAAAVYASHQQRLAEKARDRESSARAAAEGLIGQILGDLRDDLIPLGKSDLMEKATAAAERYYEVFPEADRHTSEREQSVAMWIERGDSHALQGRQQTARHCFDEALRIATALAAEQPASFDRARDEAFARARVANSLRKLDQPEEALAAYEKCLAALQILRARQPDNAELRRYESACHGEMGDALADLGRMDEAQRRYEQCVVGLKKLVADTGAKSAFRDPLALARLRLGGHLIETGKFGEAKTAFLALHTLLEDLGRERPDDIPLRALYAAALEKLGYVHYRLGDLRAAREWFEKHHDLARTMLATDTKNKAWRRQAAVAESWMGELALAEGSRMSARESFEAARELLVTLAEAEPMNGGLQNDLATNYEKLADVAEAPDDAVAALEKALTIQQRLTSRFPRSSEYAVGVVIYQRRLGDTQRSAHHWDDAAARYEAARRECRAVLARLPSLIPAHREHAHILLGLGETALAQNRASEARAALLEARQEFDALAAANRLDATDERFRVRLIERLENLPTSEESK
ncbi:MAG TPA: TIR domain-containing protein [Chthoniobacterales bacterium]|nr:TIR domain-containing protein [Chthoniobacterales bacterium]